MKHHLCVERRTACASMLEIGGTLLLGEKSLSAPQQSSCKKTTELKFENRTCRSDM